MRRRHGRSARGPVVLGLEAAVDVAGADAKLHHHRGGRGLGRTCLEMDPELPHHVLGIDEHVDQVRHRRALIAADIAHARLQQRLGDGDDAFAVKGLAVAEPELLDLLAK